MFSNAHTVNKYAIVTLNLDRWPESEVHAVGRIVAVKISSG